MKFTCDPVKNEINKANHSVSFETAVLVFDDPYHLTKRERLRYEEEMKKN